MTIKIDPEKIRDVIGKGGSVIRAMTEETGATIDIENDGTVGSLRSTERPEGGPPPHRADYRRCRSRA